MYMKNFITNITTIKQAIKSRKLVIFAGAGISVDAGVPLWHELINQLKEDIEIPKNENDYLRIAQMYFNQHQHKEYVERVRRVLKHKQVRYNKIHEAIFELEPEHILTTNYDDLLDQVIRAKSLPFSVISRDNQFPYAKNTNLLVKIHGSLDDDHFVLKEDDYLSYSESRPLTESFLRAIFTQNLVLFVGYSFSDTNLKMIVQSVRSILGKDYQNAYLLNLDEELHPTKREYWKQKGVVTINYYEAKYEEEDYILKYLNGDNALKKSQRVEDGKLKNTGQRLLDFLTFIKDYNYLYESLNKEHIIEQQYTSLLRFKEFPVLPPYFISNLYPFNNERKYTYAYQRGIMFSGNEQLINFYSQNVEEKGIGLKEDAKVGLTEIEVEKLEKQLGKIAMILNQSFIYYIQEKGDPNIVFPIEHESDTICDCPKCLYSNFQFNHLVDKINKYTITDTSDLEDDFLYAYANYKLGLHRISCLLFEEIANKAWLAGNPIYYYRAKHNIKRLRNLIAYSFDEDEPELVSKIDEINLDQVLTSLTGIDEQQREILTVVKDDEILTSTDRKIDESRDKIKKVYDLFDRGDWQRGPYHYSELQHHLAILYSFYTENCIIYDEYNEFIKICKKGIEALLISNATHESYEGRFEEFNYFFFLVFVFYGEADELKKLLNDYKVNEIKFKDSEFNKVIMRVNNLLISNHKPIPKGFQKFKENKGLHSHLNKNFFFNDKFLRIFDKVLLLLSRTKLTIEQASLIINNLHNFLEKEKYLFWKNISYLSLFISRNPDLFSKEDCIKFLKTSLDKEHYYQSDSEFLSALKIVFRERPMEDRISDKELIYDVLEYAKKVNKHEFKEDTLISLWVITDDEIRKEIGLLIEEKLKEKFNLELYRLAFWEGILSHEQFQEEYLEVFSNIKETDTQKILDKGIWSQAHDANEFLNFIGACYYKEIYFDKGIKSTIKKGPNLVKFYLLPEEFDYRKFDPHWLRLYRVSEERTSVIYKRLSKVDKIKPLLEAELKMSYNEKLGQIYLKYFL